MAVVQPPTFIADGCYEALSFRHLLCAAANNQPGILAKLTITGLSGRDVTFDEGSALIPGTTFDEGFYQIVATTPTTVTIGPGDATHSRIDLIVARVRTTEYGDVSDTASIEVVAGVAATPAVAPATPARSFVLATVTVPKNTTVLTSDMVVQTRARPGVSAIPVGGLLPYAGGTAPDGWMKCEGQAVNRAAYPDLFNAIGTTYGAPSGTTFSLPDLRGRTVVGTGDGPSTTNRTLGEQGGVESVTLSVAQIPWHDHGGWVYAAGNHNHALPSLTGVGAGTNTLGLGLYTAGADRYYGSDYAGNHQHQIPAQGGGGSHENMQPFLALSYIIRVN